MRQLTAPFSLSLAPVISCIHPSAVPSDCNTQTKKTKKHTHKKKTALWLYYLSEDQQGYQQRCAYCLFKRMKKKKGALTASLSACVVCVLKYALTHVCHACVSLNTHQKKKKHRIVMLMYDEIHSSMRTQI